MVRFKKEIISMLDYEDFVKQTLSDPELTMNGLRVAWRKFDPAILSESVKSAGCSDVEEQVISAVEEKVIPKVFSKGPGKKAMDMMVEHGYCAPSTLEWVYDGENSSYLQVLFADAIGKHLDFGRRRWFAFTSIWGEKNYSDLLSKAIECDNAKNLGLKVKETEALLRYSGGDGLCRYMGRASQPCSGLDHRQAVQTVRVHKEGLPHA